MKIDPRQMSALGAGARRAFEARWRERLETLGLPGTEAEQRVRRGVAGALDRGLRSCRAVGASLVLSELAGWSDWSMLDDDALGPRDVRMASLLDQAELPEDVAALAKEAAREPLASVGAAVAERHALERLQLAPRGVEETTSPPLVLAPSPPGQHWTTTLGDKALVVEAVCRPREDDVHSKIEWSGGAPVEGQPHWRRVPRHLPALHRIVATLGARSAVMHVWVLALDDDGAVRPVEAATRIPRACRSLRLQREA